MTGILLMFWPQIGFPPPIVDQVYRLDFQQVSGQLTPINTAYRLDFQPTTILVI